MNDNKNNTVSFMDEEKNRQIALKHVSINERGLLNQYRGPHIKMKGTEKKPIWERHFLTLTVQEKYCCFAFQALSGHNIPNCATPLGFGEYDFEKKFNMLKDQYLKKSHYYIERYKLNDTLC